MKTSEKIDEISKALSAAQAEMKPAQKNASNPFLQSKYADLASVIEASREVLTAHEIAVAQGVGNDEGRVTVTTRLMHSSGQWVESEVASQPKDQTPQSVGSVVTYLRRYGYAALVGIATEDDDGHAGTGNHAQQKQTSQPRNARPSQATPAPTGPPPETPIPENVRKRLHAIGTEVYGKEWDARRHELVKLVTRGRTETSNELTEPEAMMLINGMNKKLAEQASEDKTNVPQMNEWIAESTVPEGSGQAV